MKRIVFAFVGAVAAGFAVWSCKSPTDSSAITYQTFPDTMVVAAYDKIPTDSLTFVAALHVGDITDVDISECSGFAASRKYPGLLWTENDHGNPNIIYLVDTTGKKRATFTVNGATDRDWEDMCVGPGPDAGVTYVYLGEIGDNNAVYPSSIVYRFLEPDFTVSATPYAGSINGVAAINYKYPDGPHNAECLMIDPSTKDIYIVSKGLVTNVYVLPYPQRTDTMLIAKEVANLSTLNPSINTITAGDISADGTEIIIKNYTNLYYWKRRPGEPIWHAMLATPNNIPYIPEPKGEAMCFSPDDSRFYTSGEYKGNVPASSPVYSYLRNK